MILASLSQFDMFVLGKLQHLQHENVYDGMKRKLLSNGFNYENFTTEFCQTGNRCDMNEIKENISTVVSQLMLMNGYVKYSTSGPPSLPLASYISHIL